MTDSPKPTDETERRLEDIRKGLATTSPRGTFQADVVWLLALVERLQVELEQEKQWKIEDPRMLREQCRVGDVAFQHLFCTSKGNPMPDWCKDGLPNMYRTMEHIESLQAQLAECQSQPKRRIQRPESDMDSGA